MSEVGTQLVITLQQISRTIAAVGQSVQRSWWEMYGAPILSMVITVAGWIIIVRVNRVSNENLVELQRRDLAINRILDALDGYLGFLDDAEDPSNVLWRDRTLFDHEATIEECKGEGGAAKFLNANAGRLAFASVVLSDSRRSRWIDVLRREAWTFKMHQYIVEQVATLEGFHNDLVSDLVKFEREQLFPEKKEKTAEPSLLSCKRDNESVKAIALQRKRVTFLYEALNQLDSSRHDTTRRQALIAAIARWSRTRGRHVDHPVS